MKWTAEKVKEILAAGVHGRKCHDLAVAINASLCPACRGDAPGSTGPRGLKLGDFERPVFDGPQPGDKRPPLAGINTEGDE